MNLNQFRPFAKAAMGFIAPGVVALGAAVQDRSPGGSSITSAEWVGILVAMFATGGLVFAVPNKDGATSQEQQDQG